ncbi:MAG: type II toxin-antitoxin system HipA family toxin [Rhizobacter sp.]|nr:type II toxin-antitoxin system HipA family toxin [Rhizobacter sp.]
MSDTPATRLHVHTPSGEAGVLAHEHAYVFGCSGHAQATEAVSLTMPVRLQAYERATLHPIFQMNLPEGYLLERLRNRLAKTSGTDPLLLLSLLGGDAPIGRLRYTTGPALPGPAQAGERLSDILAYRGAEGLFDSLVERYINRSGLSGVQPKVLVPEVSHKASAITDELIVKSGLQEFPGLAINEFVCMSAVAAAGIPVPEFYLSDDRSLFVMRRFDRGLDGRALGFEDMAVLSGKNAADKYTGRYEDIAKLIKAFCPPDPAHRSLAHLFDLVAMSCLLGNGDAHLKNFGLLYEHPESDDIALAPAYDIVNTTCYLPNDSLALSLAGNKGLFAARADLLAFAVAHCNLPQKAARARLLELCDALSDTLKQHAGLAAEVPGLVEALTRSLATFRATFMK